MAKKKLSVYSGRNHLTLATSKKEATKISGDPYPYLSETGLSKFKGKIVACRYLPKLFGSNSWGMCAREDKKKTIGGWRNKKEVIRDIKKLGKDKILIKR